MSTLPLDLEATRKRLHGSDVLVHGTTYVVEVMALPMRLPAIAFKMVRWLICWTKSRIIAEDALDLRTY